MSGTPKRPHDEISYSSLKQPHNDSGMFPKQSSTIPSDYTKPYDVCQDSRIAKVTRIESRDGDRRSPLHTGYRAPLSSNNPVIAHPVTSENRSESRDGRDLRFENRDNKMEKRNLYGEVRRDSQNLKSEKDSRTEIRDDNKDSRHDRHCSSEPKSDLKIEKGSYSAASSQSWKEAKEHFRGKRYSESPSANVDSLHSSHDNTHSPFEAVKKVSIVEERDHRESRETVGENKVDSKSDDKLKEKDRKRKEVKHPDGVEKEKERNERGGVVQVPSSTTELKEFTNEERDRKGNVHCEIDGKDLSKDREHPKEKEKDSVKKEPWNGVEKAGLHNEKEVGDGSGRILEHGNVPSENKKQKDFDGSKSADKEVREMKKERDADIEGDRLDKSVQACDKELDGCVDAEEATGKEREVYDAVQQRKRMQRTRGSPQGANRDPLFRSRNADNEGSQGSSEVSFVVYKAGECMEELVRFWREYESSQMGKNVESSSGGPTLEIHIPAEYVTATNRQVRSGQLWGTDVYTYDSDLVAVLMHTGYCRLSVSPPPSAIQELRATVRVLPPQDCYISTLRNNVRSRAWGAKVGCSYRVERCCIVKRGGGTINLERSLTCTSTVEPTLAPMVVERTMTTRAASSNALRQQRLVREVTIQYNLCNEPWIKYSLTAIADKGLKKPLYTSARLKKGEVLYLETHSCRYELCFTGEKMVKAAPGTQESDANKSQNHHQHSANGERNGGDNITVDVFRWSRCKKPLPQKVMRTLGIPLPLEQLEVVEENLDWEDIQWSPTGVWIAGKEYTLTRVHFLSKN